MSKKQNYSVDNKGVSRRQPSRLHAGYNKQYQDEVLDTRR